VGLEISKPHQIGHKSRQDFGGTVSIVQPATVGQDCLRVTRRYRPWYKQMWRPSAPMSGQTGETNRNDLDLTIWLRIDKTGLAIIHGYPTISPAARRGRWDGA
jgi:hypothetical protein